MIPETELDPSNLGRGDIKIYAGPGPTNETAQETKDGMHEKLRRYQGYLPKHKAVHMMTSPFFSLR